MNVLGPQLRSLILCHPRARAWARNATGSAIALTGIELALAGVEFKIPVDEVIDVMGEIGASMDVRYRETAGGGLAATPTGRRLARERLVQIKKR